MRPLALLLVALLPLSAACGPEPSAPVAETDEVLAPLTPDPSSGDILPLENVRASQPAAVAQRVANTEITVTYSRPVARGRELFGALVPYGQVWNPGADKATSIEFTRDVRVNDQPLAAGKYSLWAIPDPDRWTMIFHGDGDTFHTPYPGEAGEVLRVNAVPEPGSHMETLAFYFPVVEGKDAVLRLHWGEVVVPLAISVP